MTEKGKGTVRSEVDICLSQWTAREMQLVRLHEEILSRREALMNCSLAYSQSQNNMTLTGTLTTEQAFIRNQKLLKDIKVAKEDVYESLNAAPTPRFMTLQKNYWSMVKSQVPMWEQDIGIERPTKERTTTPRASGTRAKTTHSTSAGKKSSVGVQPKKKHTKKQLDARQKSAKSK
ncbi:centrosomal protein 15 kDa-like [Ruditapes philippinarum]|uniref:centrosomal protein 15 kDa-like n=1 Tax=Ruditapes philippinarum TaxID=129788 RepID=UPI00295BA612|nr:centrosomal protein 15 kDa-like [Ruditapes philippinarum]